jgi:hypothetical protein
VTVWYAGQEGTLDRDTRQSPTQGDIYQMMYWYNWFFWWWALGCSKHVEKWNKYIEKSASSLLLTIIRSPLFTYQVKTFIASTNVCRINQSWKHYDKYSLGFFYSAELLARSSDARIAGTWLMRSLLIILCVYSWTFTVQNFVYRFLGHLSFPLSAICLAYEVSHLQGCAKMPLHSWHLNANLLNRM